MKNAKGLVALILAMVLILSAFPVFASGEELSVPQGEKIIYGYSGEGRELAAYRFGSGSNVLVMGFAIHGFEDHFDRDGQCLVDCAWAMMEHLEGSYLPDGYDWTIYILPCMNPDGLYSGRSAWGPGRCTTTYLDASGQLRTGKGIDLNRCFPTGFIPVSESRNYTTSRPMAAKEARALDTFLRSVKGDGKNVLVDVHGWLQKAITDYDWLMDIFCEGFADMEQDFGPYRPGFFIAHGDTLGYESVLMELPKYVRSKAAYESSDIERRMKACLDKILLTGAPGCGGEHAFAPETSEPD
jgi:hypothetical protein